MFSPLVSAPKSHQAPTITTITSYSTTIITTTTTTLTPAVITTLIPVVVTTTITAVNAAAITIIAASPPCLPGPQNEAWEAFIKYSEWLAKLLGGAPMAIIVCVWVWAQMAPVRAVVSGWWRALRGDIRPAAVVGSGRARRRQFTVKRRRRMLEGGEKGEKEE